MPLIHARALALTAGLLLLASSAFAQQPESEREPEIVRTGPSAALLVGYGHEFAQGLQGLNLGLGVAGGYTVPACHVYLGGSMLGYFGSSERARASAYRYENHHHEYALSIDVGYDAFIGRRWVLRPLLSSGLYIDLTEASVGSSSTQARNVYGFVGLGAAALVRLGPMSVGAHFGIPIFPAAFVSRLALTLGLSVGVYFDAVAVSGR